MWGQKADLLKLKFWRKILCDQFDSSLTPFLGSDDVFMMLRIILIIPSLVELSKNILFTYLQREFIDWRDFLIVNWTLYWAKRVGRVLCSSCAPLFRSVVEDIITSCLISLRKYSLLRKRRSLSIDDTTNSGSRIKQDYALNLSILLSAGKENNNDPPSKCDWSGASSNLKSGSHPTLRIVVFGLAIVATMIVNGRKFFVTRHQRGWESRMQPHHRRNTHLSFYESVWLGLHTKVGGSSLLKLSITTTSIAKK